MKLFSALILLILLASCTDPITVGSELLDSDRATVGETADLTFTTRVVREDSALTYDYTTNGYLPPSTFSFGEIQDPNFGTATHAVYLTPRLPRNASSLTVVPQFASLINVHVDSVVAILPIDTTRGFYGEGRTFPVEALEITDPVTFVANYYNDLQLATEGGDLTATGSFTASLTPQLVRDTAITNPALETAHVRVRMSDAFASRIDDLGPDVYAADSTFRDAFAGLLLRPTGPSGSLLYIAPTEATGQPAYSGFNFYYQDSTGAPAVYRIAYLLALPTVAHDYAGSLVEPLLDSTTDHTLAAVQGQGGLMTEITLGDLTVLQDRVINRAVLEIPVADVEGVSYTDYPLPTRVELFYRASAGGPLLGIEDRLELARTRASTANVKFFLGGSLEQDGTLPYYSPAFSIHLQRILDGEVPARLYLRVSPLEALEIGAARAFLNGPAAGTNPARIRVTYTDLN